ARIGGSAASLRLLVGARLLAVAFLLAIAFRLLALAFRLTGHLAREIFRLTPQLELFASQFLEAPLQFLLAQLLRRERLLFSEQLVLALRQTADLVERRRNGILLLLRGVARLVVGLLRSLQLLVEQRGDVVVAIVVPRPAGAGLLSRHLALLHLGLSLEQVIERFHLRRQRIGGLERIERRHRAPHG